VALIVGALAGVTASAIAQTPEEGAIGPSAVSNIDADRVDGKHAVGYTIKKGKRAGRLVATNAGGMLPPNIVNPFWAAIQNKPAGFADGVDDGVTGLRVTRVIGATGSAFSSGFGSAPAATCPSGAVLVGGGATIKGSVGDGTALIHSYPTSATSWNSLALRSADVGGTSTLTNYALCLSVEAGGPIGTAGRGRAVQRATTSP
jgi:hypothetical protein